MNISTSAAALLAAWGIWLAPQVDPPTVPVHAKADPAAPDVRPQQQKPIALAVRVVQVHRAPGVELSIGTDQGFMLAPEGSELSDDRTTVTKPADSAFDFCWSLPADGEVRLNGQVIRLDDLSHHPGGAVRLELIAVPRVVTNPGEEAVVELRSQPPQYLVPAVTPGNPTGLYRLVTSEQAEQLRVSVTAEHADDGGIELSPVEIRMTTITSREQYEGVGLEIGRPTFQERIGRVQAKLAPGRVLLVPLRLSSDETIDDGVSVLVIISGEARPRPQDTTD